MPAATFTPRAYSPDEQDPCEESESELGIMQSKKIFNAIFEGMIKNYPVVSLSVANRDARCTGMSFELIQKFWNQEIKRALKDGRITLRESIDKSEDSFSVTGLNKSAKKCDEIDRLCFRVKE